MQYPPESQQRQTAVFHPNAVFLETSKNDWEGTIGFPVDYLWTACSEATTQILRDEILQSKELDINNHWLVHKEQVGVSMLFVYGAKLGVCSVLFCSIQPMIGCGSL